MSDWIPEPVATPPAPAAAPPAPSVRRVLGVSICLVLLGMGLTWAFLSMRAVMGVGGSCASGGAYQIATPCPDGTWLIAIGIPMMIIAAMAGSAFATALEAPNLLVPMWAFLFTSLGWNFLEYGAQDGLVWGWLVCGVLFWAMAAPAWWVMGAELVGTLRKKPSGLVWWATYVGLGACGAFLGLAIYSAAS
ncbi:MAG TPA: hypothetical protein VNS55_00730 [Nocardioides sp.]|nr:hypothetical protein [Nocardioides sp.]